MIELIILFVQSFYDINLRIFRQDNTENSSKDKAVSTREETEVKLIARSNQTLVKTRKKKKKRKKRKDKSAQKKEKKATQTLAIVLGEIFSDFMTNKQRLKRNLKTQ